MIEVSDLTKSYGPIRALEGISFNVKSGEIVGLLGPNGAGKTTFIKILTGYLQPDAGTVTVDGRDVQEHTRTVQAEIGYLPETAPLYPELTVQAYLQMMADLRVIPEDQQVQRISDAVYATGLEDHLTRLIGQLSKGFRQRVGLAQAILHRPKLLILDEPTIGLDPTQIVEIRNLIRRLSEHSTVLFSTHILSEVEALCDRVIILINGHIKADARLAELAATSDAVVVFDREVAGVEAQLRRLKPARDVSAFRSIDGYPAYRVLGKSDAGDHLTPEIYGLARAHDWPLRELRKDARTLETIFNELVQSAAPVAMHRDAVAVQEVA
ncbi:MAG: ATP-binding cassette domain-containing protein [Anaerolineae bacterium]|nr:ATP-binding cassette domain-containing protein [Anaerolineae bacterium]